ncbi:protein turtle homolog B-like [Tachysurus ichikawai]
MPQIQDILESVHGATVFSTLDLKTRYWQVLMDESSIQKIAFVTKYNQYEFVRLPFGLKNAGATFQRLMNKVLQDLIGKCCFMYIDDIVVYSRDIHQHFQDLKKVFAGLESAGLTLNLRKCKLVRKSLTFLGHVISEEGVKTEDFKVDAVKNFPMPKNIKEVERFLGLGGWYHRFI